MELLFFPHREFQAESILNEILFPFPFQLMNDLKQMKYIFILLVLEKKWLYSCVFFF